MFFIKWQNSEGNWLICNIDNPNNGVDIDLTEEQAEEVLERLEQRNELLTALAEMVRTELYLPDHPQRQEAYKQAQAIIEKIAQ